MVHMKFAYYLLLTFAIIYSKIKESKRLVIKTGDIMHEKVYLMQTSNRGNESNKFVGQSKKLKSLRKNDYTKFRSRINILRLANIGFERRFSGRNSTESDDLNGKASCIFNVKSFTMFIIFFVGSVK